MKKNINIILGVIVSIIMLVVSSFLISFLLSEMKNLNPNVVASIIAALTATFGFLYNQRRTQKREIAETHRQKKVELYNDFINFMIEYLYKSNKGKYADLPNGEVSPDVEQEFMKFHSGLIVWGSPEVIKRYVLFRNYSSKLGIEYTFRHVHDLLLAIRKDLGNSNYKLKED